MILPQQQAVRGGGTSASLALGGDGGAPGRRLRSTGRETHFGNFCRLSATGSHRFHLKQVA